MDGSGRDELSDGRLGDANVAAHSYKRILRSAINRRGKRAVVPSRSAASATLNSRSMIIFLSLTDRPQMGASAATRRAAICRSCLAAVDSYIRNAATSAVVHNG